MSSVAPKLTWGDVFASTGVSMLVYFVLDNPLIDRFYEMVFIKYSPFWRSLFIGLFVSIILTSLSSLLGEKLTTGDRFWLFFYILAVVALFSYGRYSIACKITRVKKGDDIISKADCAPFSRQLILSLITTLLFGLTIFSLGVFKITS